MRTFAVINQKGGCGKTTTAINLAAAFAELGHRTLLVDMDPQGHCGLGLAVPENQIDRSIADALLNDGQRPLDFNDLLWQISGKLDLVPATTSLAAAEIRLADKSDRDLRLARALATVTEQYELCVIDCPPSLGLLTFNALRAANEVIIPVDTGYFALSGSIKQAAALQMLADRCGHQVAFHVLPTMYDVRTRMAREIIAELRKHFGDRVLETTINFNAKLKEAASFGQPIHEYDPGSRGASDFDMLARDLLTRTPKPQRFASTTLDSSDFRAIGRAAVAAGPAAIDPPASAMNPLDADSPFTPSVELITLSVAAASPVASVTSSSTTSRPVSAEIHVGVNATPVTLPANPPPSRVADLVARAKALADKAADMHAKLAADPQITKLDQIHRTEIGDGDEPARIRSLQEKLARLYGVRVTQQGTVFVQPVTEAKRICVSGDFNYWSPSATPLRRNPRLGVWETCVPLPPGRYRYRLVVDGRWMPDPHNDKVEVNPYGEFDNIVEVQ